MKRSLYLRREVLDELSPGELVDVVGAVDHTVVMGPVRERLSYLVSCFAC